MGGTFSVVRGDSNTNAASEALLRNERQLTAHTGRITRHASALLHRNDILQQCLTRTLTQNRRVRNLLALEEKKLARAVKKIKLLERGRRNYQAMLMTAHTPELPATKCIVCATSQREIVVRPCMHLVACSECMPRIVESQGSRLTCPICRMLECSTDIGKNQMNFQMEQYVLKRNDDGVYVFNLQRTWEKLVLAARAIADIENPASVFVVSAQPFAQRAVLKFSEQTGATHVAEFAHGGVFGIFKEERPSVVVFGDTFADRAAIGKAAGADIPIISFCNTDAQATFVDFVVPCNTQGRKSVALLWAMLAREVLRMRDDVSPEVPRPPPSPETSSEPSSASELSDDFDFTRDSPAKSKNSISKTLRRQALLARFAPSPRAKSKDSHSAKKTSNKGHTRDKKLARFAPRTPPKSKSSYSEKTSNNRHQLNKKLARFAPQTPPKSKSSHSEKTSNNLHQRNKKLARFAPQTPPKSKSSHSPKTSNNRHNRDKKLARFAPPKSKSSHSDKTSNNRHQRDKDSDSSGGCELAELTVPDETSGGLELAEQTAMAPNVASSSLELVTAPGEAPGDQTATAPGEASDGLELAATAPDQVSDQLNNPNVVETEVAEPVQADDSSEPVEPVIIEDRVANGTGTAKGKEAELSADKTVKCSMCDESLRFRDPIHIWAKHMGNRMRFECFTCKSMHQRLSQFRCDGHATDLVDHQYLSRELYAIEFSKCFPSV